MISAKKCRYCGLIIRTCSPSFGSYSGTDYEYAHASREICDKEIDRVNSKGAIKMATVEPGLRGEIEYVPQPTLTKRDYFAAMAMQGMMSIEYELLKKECDGQKICNYVAKNSIIVADALIEELKKGDTR